MLPVPTLEQTARFAHHVADNHSWYKHLPFFPPGASFVLFPTPHAGRGVNFDGNRFVIHEVERGDYFAHHSRLPTAEYLARFGHWDYWVDDNPRASDPQPGPWVYSPDGARRELLADGLKRQWSCRLTAFLKPAPPMFNLRASDLEREAEAFETYARAHYDDPSVARYHAVVRKLRRAAESWDNPGFIAFLESEATEQRELLLGTLHRVRAAWSEVQGGHASP